MEAQWMAAAQRQLEAHQHMIQCVIDEQLPNIAAMSRVLVECYQRGNKSLWCGNGGSAADAQHLAAELVGRYLIDRTPLPALALHTDTSVLTAIGNDFGYDQVFARQVKAHFRPGDVLVCLTTSGHSANIIAAAHAAKQIGGTVLGLLGRDGGAVAPLCDHALIVPSQHTYLIQEVGMVVGHFLCDQVEQALFTEASL